MTPIATVHHNGSLTALEVDMDIFLTAPTLQLHIVKVNIFKVCKFTHLSHTCTARDPCSDPEAIRLTKYISDTFGRLEVCSDGYWGSVCGIGATDAIADVACRQLNHATEGIYMYNIIYK